MRPLNSGLTAVAGLNICKKRTRGGFALYLVADASKDAVAGMYPRWRKGQGRTTIVLFPSECTVPALPCT